jgi:hypothetical protein
MKKYFKGGGSSGGVILRVGKHVRRRHLTRRQTPAASSYASANITLQGSELRLGSLPSPRWTLPPQISALGLGVSSLA